MTEDLDSLAGRLKYERAVPSAAFRGTLKRHLIGPETRSPRRSRPRNLRVLVSAYAGSGILLLAVAAIGLAGIGPLSA